MAEKFDFVGQWREIVAEFIVGTGKAQPDQTLKTALKKYKDVDTALDDATKAYAAYEGTVNKTKKLVEIFEKAAKAYDKSQKRYVKDIEAAIKADKKLNAGQKTDYQKWLKVLAKHCDAMSSSLKSMCAAMYLAIKKVNAFELTAKPLVKTVQAACKRAEALIAHVKANPTAATFNDGIMKAARDINQPMGNVKNLRDKGYKFPKKMTNDQADTLFKILRPWAGGQRALDNQATRAEVLRELDAFRQVVKAAEKWCGM